MLTVSASLSTQIIYRGPRSAGYGFVAFSTLEAAQKAAELLNKKELDGRSVIVEIAKPAEEKHKERSEWSERRPTKKRVPKKVKAAATADVAPAMDDAGDSAAEKTEGEAKPKKKRNTVSFCFALLSLPYLSDTEPSFSARPRELRLPLALPKTMPPQLMPPQLLQLLPKRGRRGSRGPRGPRGLPNLQGLLVKPL